MTLKAPLSVSQILASADAYHARTGHWPNILSGAVAEAPTNTWKQIDGALHAGCRGLPGGSFLPRLLQAQRGVRIWLRKLPLTVTQIRVWADAYHERSGCWPRRASGPVAEISGEDWCNIGSGSPRGRSRAAGRLILGSLAGEGAGSAQMEIPVALDGYRREQRAAM